MALFCAAMLSGLEVLFTAGTDRKDTAGERNVNGVFESGRSEP